MCAPMEGYGGTAADTGGFCEPGGVQRACYCDLMEAGTSSKRLLPWLVAVAFFMESLDTTILNTAVPAIAEALKVAPLSMKAVLSSYTF